MRHLDFIVFGVGRSGTTALVKALNLHPDVLCGVERFGHETDPRTIVVPDSFRDPRHVTQPRRLQRTLEYLEQKDVATCLVGDKNPRYHCNVAAWKALVPAARSIAIYRSPYEYLDSWRRRAESSDDDAWPREQVGLFGLWEMFTLLRNCLDSADDTLFVPYEACFFDNPDVIKQVTAHIGADPDRFNQKRFLKTLFAQAKRSRQRPHLPDEETRLLEVADVDAIDRILIRGEAFIIGDLRQEIEAYLSCIGPDLAVAGEQWLSARRSLRMSRYLNHWAGQNPKLQSIPNDKAVPLTFRKCAAYAKSRRARNVRSLRMALSAGKQSLNQLRLRFSGGA